MRNEMFVKTIEWRNSVSNGDRVTYKDMVIAIIIGMVPIANIICLIMIICAGRKVYYKRVK